MLKNAKKFLGFLPLKRPTFPFFSIGDDPKLLAELEKTLKSKTSKSKSLRADLVRAIQAKDVDLLEKAIDAFKAAGLTQVRTN